MALEYHLGRIERDIKAQGYAPVHFPLCKKELVDAAESFLEFLTVNPAVKSALEKKRETDSGYDLGYISRDQKQGDYETKEAFHYHPAIDKLAEHLNNPRVTRFVGQARQVYSASIRVLEGIIEAMVLQEPHLKDLFFKKEENKCYLRFLSYPVQAVGKTAADGHYDRGPLSLALAESAPGLYIKSKLAMNEEHKALLFPGLTFKEITKNLRWNPSWHQSEQSVLAKRNVGRWAIVFFANEHNQRPISRAEARTRKHF
jgi:isopenicillin N synthase-like dioxygenase